MTSESILRSVQRGDGRDLFAWDALRSDIEELDRGGEILWIGPDPFLSPWFARALLLARERGYESWAEVHLGAAPNPRRIAAAAAAGLRGVVLPEAGNEVWIDAVKAHGVALARRFDPNHAEVSVQRAAAEGAHLRWPEGRVCSPEAFVQLLASASASGVHVRTTVWPVCGPVTLPWDATTASLVRLPAPQGIEDGHVTVVGLDDALDAQTLQKLGIRTPELPRCHGGAPRLPRAALQDPTCHGCSVRTACAGPSPRLPARREDRFRALPARARIVIIDDPPAPLADPGSAQVAAALTAMGFMVELHRPEEDERDTPPVRRTALRKRAWQQLDLGAADLVVTTDMVVATYRAHPTVRPGTRFVTWPTSTSLDEREAAARPTSTAAWALARAWAFGLQ